MADPQTGRFAKALLDIVTIMRVVHRMSDEEMTVVLGMFTRKLLDTGDENVSWNALMQVFAAAVDVAPSTLVARAFNKVIEGQEDKGSPPPTQQPS